MIITVHIICCFISMFTTLCVRKAIMFLKISGAINNTNIQNNRFVFHTGFSLCPDRTHSFQGHSEVLLMQQKRLALKEMSVCTYSCIMVCTLDYILEQGVCKLNAFVLNRLLFFQWKSLESPAGMVSQNLRVSGETFFGQPHHHLSCVSVKSHLQPFN